MANSPFNQRKGAKGVLEVTSLEGGKDRGLVRCTFVDRAAGTGHQGAPVLTTALATRSRGTQ